MTAATTPRHVRPGRLARMLRREDRPAAFPAQDPGDGRDLAGAVADVPEMPWPPLPAPSGPASLASLRRVADGLRVMDGPPARDYREARGHLETVPFQAVRPFPDPAWKRPSLTADLTDLPLFREAVRGRTRCHAGQCRCGSGLGGGTWGERMVSAGAHLLGGAS